MTDTDPIEIDDDMPAADVLMAAAGRLRDPIHAAKVREIAGYVRRRFAAVEVGDIALVDELTERCGLVAATLTENELKLVAAAVEAVEAGDPVVVDVIDVPAPPADPSPPGDVDTGHGVDLAAATHAQLDALIEGLVAEHNFDPDTLVEQDDDLVPLSEAKIDAKRAGVAAALEELAAATVGE